MALHKNSAKPAVTISTTSLMRQAGDLAGGDVATAIGILRSWSYKYPNAKSGIRVITERAKGAPRFRIEPTGFVVGVWDVAA